MIMIVAFVAAQTAVAASQLSAPFPIDVENWFSYQDYPTDVASGSQTVFEPVTQTLVNADGKIVGCRIETPSSSPKVDALACAIILKRGHFQAARWSDGTAVPGLYRWCVSFVVYGDSHDRYSDIELQVGSLGNHKKSEYVTVDYSSDANGRIDGCVGARPLRPHDKPSDPQLVTLACKAVQDGWKPFKVLGTHGESSRSVQNAVVKFTADAAR